MRIVSVGGMALLVLLPLGACTGGGSGDEQPATTAAPPTAASAPTTTTTSECPVDGRARTVDGVRVREFCGPARAVVRVGPEEVHDFTSGRCIVHDTWFELHLGVEVVDAEAGGESQFRSFTMLLGHHPLAAEGAPPASGDGTYHEAVVTFSVPGATYALNDKTVVLEGDRSRGSVSGVALRSGGADPVQIRTRFACTIEGATAIDPEEIEEPPTTTTTSTTTTTTATDPDSAPANP